MLSTYRVVGAPSRAVVQKLTYGLFLGPVALGLALLVVAPRPAPAPAFAAAPQAVRQAPRVAVATLVMPVLPALSAGMVKNVARAPSPPPPPAAYDPDPALSVVAAPPQAPRTVNALSADVEVTDDGRLIVRGEVVSLAGVGLPEPGRLCRRLDGVEVTCIERIVARLAIVARGRKVACDIRTSSAGERVGRCRADKIDLAEDLVQSRLVERREAAAPVAKRIL